MGSKAARAAWVCVVVTGALMIAAGLAIGIVLPQTFDKEVARLTVVDSPTAKGYKDWTSSEFDNVDGGVARDLWLFNLTNAAEVARGAKPVLQKVGPYSYRYFQRAAQVEFLDDGRKALSVDRIVYVPTPTSRDHNERVTLFNPVYLAAVTAANGESAVVVKATSTLFGTLAAGLTSNATRDKFLIAGSARVFAKVAAGFPGGMKALLPFWANATTSSGVPALDALRVSALAGAPTGISAEAAAGVWSALTDAMRLGMWALTRTAPAVGLSEAQARLVTVWALRYVKAVAEPALAATLGCGSDLADVGYAQWANAMPGGGASVLPAPSTGLEYAVWRAKTNSSAALTVAQAKAILTAFTSPYGLGAFLRAIASPAGFAALAPSYGNVTYAQGAAVAAYVTQYVQKNWILPLYRSWLGDSGAFATKPVRDFLFGGHDSFLEALTQRKVAPGLFFNDTTAADAVARNATTLKWTGKGNMRQLNQIIAKNGATTVKWATGVKVDGVSGVQFQNRIEDPRTYEPATWNAETNRPLNFAFDRYEKVAGILDTARYELKQSELWPINEVFFNHIAGFANMTSTSSGVPIFYSVPFMSHEDAVHWRANFTLDAQDPHGKWSQFLNVEPMLGTTMRAQLALQLNVYVDPVLKQRLSVTMPGLTAHQMVPLGYLVTGATADDGKLEEVSTKLRMRSAAVALLPGLVVPGAVLMAAGVALVVFSFTRRSQRREEKCAIAMDQAQGSAVLASGSTATGL
eukprot:m51a1_g3137 hypothetical protein (748) ;mRNA; f:298253-300612